MRARPSGGPVEYTSLLNWRRGCLVLVVRLALFGLPCCVACAALWSAICQKVPSPCVLLMAKPMLDWLWLYKAYKFDYEG